MRSLLVIAIALAAVPLAVLAQPAKQEAKQSTDLPCKLTDYRVVRSDAQKPPDTVAVLCDGSRLADFAATAVLYVLQDESVAIPAVETANMQGPTARSGFWLVFRFKNSLKAGQDYELRLSGTYARPTNPNVMEKFSGTRFRFSTRPDLSVAKTPGRDAVYLTSHFEMQVSDQAKLIDKSHNKEYKLEAIPIEPDEYDARGQILIPNGPSTPGERSEARAAGRDRCVWTGSRSEAAESGAAASRAEEQRCGGLVLQFHASGRGRPHAKLDCGHQDGAGLQRAARRILPDACRSMWTSARARLGRPRPTI